MATNKHVLFWFVKRRCSIAKRGALCFVVKRCWSTYLLAYELLRRTIKMTTKSIIAIITRRAFQQVVKQTIMNWKNATSKAALKGEQCLLNVWYELNTNVTSCTSNNVASFSSTSQIFNNLGKNA